MLDVHVAILNSTPPDWVEQCRASVAAAAACAGFPVFAHFIPGVIGHVGLARQAGYSHGTQPYVAYVDDDDYVLPRAFACLADALASGTAAAFAREVQAQNGHMTPVAYRHNGWACRRDVLDGFDFAAHPYLADVKTRALAAAHPDGVVDIHEHVYVYRLRLDSPARLLKRKLAHG